MLTDNDKCPTCGGPITWGTDMDALDYCGHVHSIWYSYIMCEKRDCFMISNWEAVSLDTFTGTRRKLEERLEEEYRAIFERSCNQQDLMIRDSKLEMREGRAAKLLEQLESFKW